MSAFCLIPPHLSLVHPPPKCQQHQHFGSESPTSPNVAALTFYYIGVVGLRWWLFWWCANPFLCQYKLSWVRLRLCWGWVRAVTILYYVLFENQTFSQAEHFPVNILMIATRQKKKKTVYLWTFYKLRLTSLPPTLFLINIVFDRVLIMLTSLHYSTPPSPRIFDMNHEILVFKT